MQPEVPEKSQRTPTASSHSFGSMQSVGAWCGLVRVHRWSALNDRHRVLLESLAAGKDPHAWAPGEWPSAYALRDRDLLKMSHDSDGVPGALSGRPCADEAAGIDGAQQGGDAERSVC